jgi:hypothetical protein
MSRNVEQSLLDIDFASLTRGPFTPSPAAWEDQAAAPPAATLTVEKRAGLPTVRIQLPPAGFAIYHASPSLHRLGPHPPEDLKPWPREVWHAWTQRT